ncbi:MAG TPA: GNAT family N-acetyltransferase [Candidatus Thermoplasmatota archaeon]|nr:GNAT family N-acetyltransferase [Candidatus Thermoplasmatota archaeon]
MTSTVVRRATRSDADAFLRLVDALARYEKLDPPGPEARARLVEDAFGPRPRFALLVAERAGAIIGYAILVETYSSFLARPTLYLEDVFVAPEARNKGAGRALVAACAKEALARGCHRLEGVVLDWNEPARGFYAATGGAVLDDWRLLRYDRAALERLAG